MDGMYETFEHTADLGLRIRAGDLDTLFAEAAAALFSTVIEDLAAVEPAKEIVVELPADELPLLLFDWLRELLYQFDVEHLVFGRFEVHVAESGLSARAWGEPLDPARHVPNHEVKAITYHGLCVDRTADGWQAEVIIDI